MDEGEERDYMRKESRRLGGDKWRHFWLFRMTQDHGFTRHDARAFGDKIMDDAGSSEVGGRRIDSPELV